MIKSVTGNIFESQAEALINTVNTVGVMGKGIALQFKERFPNNYDAYRKACKDQKVVVGSMFVTAINQIDGPSWIINFPTKQHWKGSSKYEYIEEGLEDLVNVINELGIRSIAIPPLGAGHGGLQWAQVKQMILGKLSDLPVDIELYEPSFQPKIETKKESVGLTKARALILAMIKHYQVLGFETTHLEIQKLAYFLQRMGQSDLRLQYKKYNYGPFAFNLQHLLSHIEGSYLQGNTRIMDSRPLDSVQLIPEKISEIDSFIQDKTSEQDQKRLARVAELIEGFESPFGMELLSTVDWSFANEHGALDNNDVLIKAVRGWNERKSETMSKDMILIAANRLKKHAKALYF